MGRTGCSLVLFQALQLARKPPQFLVTILFECFVGLCRLRIAEVCLDFVSAGSVVGGWENKGQNIPRSLFLLSSMLVFFLQLLEENMN